MDYRSVFIITTAATEIDKSDYVNPDYKQEKAYGFFFSGVVRDDS